MNSKTRKKYLYRFSKRKGLLRLCTLRIRAKSSSEDTALCLGKGLAFLGAISSAA